MDNDKLIKEGQEKLKQLNKQIKAASSEKDRLEGVVKQLDISVVLKRENTEEKIFELEGTIASKKREVLDIAEAIKTKTDELNEVQEELTEVKENTDKAKLETVVIVAEKRDVLSESNEIKRIIVQNRETIVKEREDATTDIKKERDAVLLEISKKIEDLASIEFDISKATFIKETADKAISETVAKNSELEKSEKDLRNKIAAQKKMTEDFSAKEVELLRRVEDASVKVASDEAIQAKAEAQRVLAEEDLEVVNRKLLSSINRFNGREAKFAAREEILKEVYKKSGIEYPNI